MGWLSDWKYRRKITISSANVDPTTTFVDSSSGAKTATFVGITETKAVKKVGNAAGYFDGFNRAYYADHADWQLGGGTGDFTIEAWVYFLDTPASGASRTICSQVTDASNYWTFRLENVSGTLKLRFVQGGTAIDQSQAWTPSTSTWYHVAVTRSGNDFKLWVDGTQLGSTVTDADGISNLAANLNIGGHGTASYLKGYLDELRISNSARYTTTFTPSTTAFTDDANTKLLLHFEGTNADLTNFPVAIRIDASCGTGASDLTDIFDEIDTSNLKLAVTTSDGETQCYVEVAFWDATAEIGTLFVKVPTVSGSSDTELYIYFDSTKSDNSTYVGVVTSTPAKSVWDEYFTAVYHLCETPSGAGSIKDSTATGAHGTPSATPPTLADGLIDKALDMEKDSTQHVTIACNPQTALDIGSTGHTLTVLASSLVSPTIKKFGNGSLRNFGTAGSTGITIPDHADFRMGGGTGDFTIDTWIRWTNLSTLYQIICGSHQDGNNRWYWAMYNNCTTMLFRNFVASTTANIDMSVSWTPTVDTWYHLALVRSGNDFKFFVNGTQQGSTLTDSDSMLDSTANFRIAQYNGGNELYAYIDDFRISDVARWTSNFTAPSTAHVSDSNTKLLIPCNITSPSAQGAENCTYEVLCKPESIPASSNWNGLLFCSNSTAGQTLFGISYDYNAASDARFDITGRDSSSSFAILDTQANATAAWYHVAGVWNDSGNTMRLFVDGYERNINTASKGPINLVLPNKQIGLGAWIGADTRSFDGLIDEARVSITNRSAAWILATKYSLNDAFHSFSSSEEYTVEVALSSTVPQLIFEAFGITVEQASNSIDLGFAELIAQAYDPTIEFLYVETTLGFAQAVFEAFGITIDRLTEFVQFSTVSSKKPTFVCSVADPSFVISAGRKPSAVSSVLAPSHTVSGRKPTAIFSEIKED